MDLQGQSGQGWRKENLWSPSGYEFRPAQLLANRYTHYVIPASSQKCGKVFVHVFKGLYEILQEYLLP